MSPERPDLVLPADIPDIELDVLVCNTFNVEANCWYSGDILIELELIEDCYREVVSLSFGNIPLVATRKRIGDRMLDILRMPIKTALERLTCLSGSIEAKHKNAHLFRTEDLAQHFGDLTAHIVCSRQTLVGEKDTNAGIYKSS